MEFKRCRKMNVICLDCVSVSEKSTFSETLKARIAFGIYLDHTQISFGKMFVVLLNIVDAKPYYR